MPVAKWAGWSRSAGFLALLTTMLLNSRRIWL
jgi:hypothetical protein